MATCGGLNGKGTYCLCKKPYKDGQFMIECSVCNDWFHGSCVKITEENSSYIDEYHCPSCQKIHGPLILKKRYLACLDNDQEFETSPSQGSMRTGSAAFIRELKEKNFASADKLPVVCLQGHEVTIDYFERSGFENPILVDCKDGLELQVPSANFSIQTVEDLVGPMREIDVIDVSKQEDHKMFLREWTDYFTRPNKKKILNLLSLEFSNSKLAEIVDPPRVVKELSWVSCHWPSETVDSTYLKPEVQRYCLMSVKDSYTDFHIDFGGSSVWYHIVRGEKVFYLIPPTAENLSLYKDWMKSPRQHEIFFADLVDICYKAVIRAGQTVFLPSGWIHAVWTPTDSLVFGGNFLHSFNIIVQLKVYDLELQILAPVKYLFPNFEPVHWFAAKCIENKITDCLERGTGVPSYLVEGVKTLIFHLRKWSRRKDIKKTQPVPYSIKYKTLLRDLDNHLSLLVVGPKRNEHGKAYHFMEKDSFGSPAKKKNKTWNISKFIKK